MFAKSRDLLTNKDSVLTHNEAAYKALGFGAQRKYPNEELCRFMGRNYFGIDRDKRSEVRILELGCGSAPNLWMVAREGFDAYGIDLSPAALPLANEMLSLYGVNANLSVGDMTKPPYPSAFFDCVIDVFSSYCLDEADFEDMLGEVSRVLKPGGKFFVYTPGKNSDAWKNCAPASKIDSSTLEGISRNTSAYYPSPYPFRFVSHEELRSALARNAMRVEYAETVSRTYRNGEEYFEFVVVEATRVS